MAPKTPKTARKPLLLARRAAPADLFSPEAWQMLLEKLPARVAYCQQRHEGMCWWLYGQESEPFWGDWTTICCAGQSVRGLELEGLRKLMGMEIERVARLMGEAHPGHNWAEGLAALWGALRRLGQGYRELRWRCGELRARAILAGMLFALPA